MTNEAQVSYYNRVGWALLGSAKLTGIVAVGLLYAQHLTASAVCGMFDFVFIGATITVCMKNWNLANRLEGQKS
jgi:hypothetical protein